MTPTAATASFVAFYLAFGAAVFAVALARAEKRERESKDPPVGPP